ncbi:hypothetical protein TNCV_996271 [Trichonephila clavipes]|nr:hypothetical protein TNCV_996271 [Trichonephila clavipes]
MRVGSVCHRIVETPTDLAASGNCLSSRRYPGKGPISDMQYHGVGRHHDLWPHAPTCGCEWDYDGPTILLMKSLLPHVRLFPWCCR